MFLKQTQRCKLLAYPASAALLALVWVDVAMRHASNADALAVGLAALHGLVAVISKLCTRIPHGLLRRLARSGLTRCWHAATGML